VVKLLNVSRRHAGGHGLDALARARPEQPLKIHRCPAAMLDPAKPSQERGEPSLKGSPPAACGCPHHGTSREHHPKLPQKLEE
jgi:hypothetical protein